MKSTIALRGVTYMRVLALGMVVTALALLLATYARAQEPSNLPAPGAAPIRTTLEQNRDERGALRQENQEEREALRTQNQEEVANVREEGGSPQDVSALRRENATERADLYTANQEERQMLRMGERRELSDAIAQKREELAQEQFTRMENRSEGRAPVFQQGVQDRLSTLLTRSVTRFEAAVTRLENIRNRVASRSEGLAQVGLATSDVDLLLEEARLHLETARDDLTQFGLLASRLPTSDNPKQDVAIARDTASILKETLKMAHASLHDAVAALAELERTGASPEGSNDNDAPENTLDGVE